MNAKNYTIFSTITGIGIFACSLGVIPSTIYATTISNDNFQLQIDEVETPLDIPEQKPAPQQKTEQEYSPGVAFIPSPFGFSITEPLIDFGILSATTPVIRTTTIAIMSPVSGYQVLAFANHELRSKSNVSIPDTTCDNGSCSEITSATWENNLTYGFGFRCDASSQNVCANDFEEKQSYKQFSNHGKKEPTLTIIQNQTPTINQDARITYKINISGTQQKEDYNNIITYIAVPNF